MASYTIDLDKQEPGKGGTTDLNQNPFLAPDATIKGSGPEIAKLVFTITGPDAEAIKLSENAGQFDLVQLNDHKWELVYTGSGTDPNWQKALRSVTVTDTKGANDNGTTIRVVAEDESGNKLSNVAKDTVICFLEGTMIATPQGERAVQDLKIGDAVLTAEGAETTVKWVGIQTVSRYFADPARSFPIRIRANAIADQVPSRDLLVSPDHALLVEGVLVHAGALINGTSVTREETPPATFRYFHIETPEHALILAENTPAETFIDNVDRMNFDNWAEHETLYGQDEPVAEMAYPRAKSARQVPMAVRATLAARSGARDTAAA